MWFNSHRKSHQGGNKNNNSQPYFNPPSFEKIVSPLETSSIVRSQGVGLFNGLSSKIRNPSPSSKIKGPFHREKSGYLLCSSKPTDRKVEEVGISGGLEIDIGQSSNTS
jgi:hypothetical protein